MEKYGQDSLAPKVKSVNAIFYSTQLSLARIYSSLVKFQDSPLEQQDFKIKYITTRDVS